MRWYPRFFRRGLTEKHLDAELRFHVEQQTADYISAGMKPEEARRRALLEFGGLDQVKEECRDVGASHILESLIQDLRYGFRMMAKNPGFTVVAVLTLALGIGANTAIFQLLDAVRLRMLPVENPQQLAEVHITATHGRMGSFYNWHAMLTYAQWEQIRDRQRAFSGVLAWAPDRLNLAPRGEVQLVDGIWVSGDFFRVLGVHPILGRVFTADDDQRGCGAGPGAVVSYSFWQRELGGDPAAIGRKFTIDYHAVEVLGVTPASFYGLDVGRKFAVALPICSQPVLGGEDNYLDTRFDWWLTVMGRLLPGWTIEKASAQLSTISPGVFEATLPPGYDVDHIQKYLAFKLAAYPAGNGISSLRSSSSSLLGLLLAITGLVLLIACANLANLMLARSSARERELAVRQALGASRHRLIRQLLAESLLLAVVGAGAGLFLARSLAGFMVTFLSTRGNQVFLNLHPGWTVFAFATTVAVLAALLFGLLPALRCTRLAPTEAMKSGGRGLTAGRQRFGLRGGLVVSQVAFSLVLLVGAFLFIRSLRNLLTIQLGFQRTGLLITELDFSRLNLPADRRDSFRRELLEQVRSTPGVDSAAAAAIVPTEGSSMNRTVWLEGTDPAQARSPWFNWVSPQYFKTMGTPLLAGRDFDEHDTAASPKVAIVNLEFARQFTNGSSPIGKRIVQRAELGKPRVDYEIVGVVANTKYQDLREEFPPLVYAPGPQFEDFYQGDQIIIIRSQAPLVGLTSRVKQTVARVSPDVAIEFNSMESTIHDHLLSERLMATLSGFFGVLAAMLATLGLYGVMSYTVARRTNEIGIRMALGAGRRELAGMVIREAGRLLVTGIAAGAVLAMACGRATASLIFGLRPYDPVTVALAATLLAAVGVAASYLPARRATKVDPMVALRHE